MKVDVRQSSLREADAALVAVGLYEGDSLPAEVADAVVFLLRSEFITGQILHVTGGEELVVGPSAAGSLSD